MIHKILWLNIFLDERKGIILAGGKGTRLYPLTKSVSKQMLPVYDKPMIYYPHNLDALWIKDINNSTQEIKKYLEIYGNGSSLGMKIQFKVQESPDGLAHALLIAKTF